MLIPLLLVALTAAQTTAAESPRALVRHAIAAVEGDSVAPVRARWRRAAERTPPDRGAVLGLATLARLTYDYSAADSLYARLQSGAPSADPIAAYGLLGRALAARARGALRDADRLFDNASHGARAAGDSVLATEALIMLATTRARTAGPVAAESLFQHVAAATEGDVALQAAYHCGRAEMLALSFRAAGAEAREGAELAARAGEHRLRAQCLHLAAADRARQGSIAQAVVEFAYVAAERRRLHDRAGLASTLQWRGATLTTAGWLQQATRDLAEAVTEARASGNGSAEAWALNNLASASMAVGDAGAAAAYADTAAQRFAAQGDRYGEAGPHIAQGLVALFAGQLDRARAAYRKAIELYEPLGFAGGLLISHLGLAHVAMRAGDWAEAERELDAAAHAGGAGGQSAMLRGLRYHRAVLALRRGQLATADALLTEQLQSVRETARLFPGAAQPNWEYFDATRLAEVKLKAGHIAAAETLALSAAEALDRWRASLSQRELRLQAYQVSEDRSDPDLGTATVIATLAAAGRVEPAFHLAERLRARDLLDHIARAEGLATVDSTHETTARSAALAVVATHAEITAALPDSQTALLEFVTGLGGEPTTVFVLTRDALRAHQLAPVDTLEPLIDRLNSLLESGADPRDLARTLGARLLDSVLVMLPPYITRLVTIPDGALHRVPFDALVMSDGKFVVQRYAVGIVPSATVAARLWKTPRRSGPVRVLAFADPAIRHASGDADTLPRLRASRREARLVARYGGDNTVRLGAQASEAWLKHTALPSYRVLHFATHARADEATLSGTAIALAPGNGEDGLVGPGELGRLQLDADLVVLSACRSGGGVVVRGEGIVGLAAPLLAAGARAIALTRWTIGDRQTVTFIEAFYRALAAHEPVADALRSAKLDAIARGAPPAEWAAFTIVGDPTITVPLDPLRGGRTIWWIGASALVLLVVSVAGWRRARRRAARVAP